ncbi:uncharacterized protein PgNI_00658 [Pyricularia grisea]|uniref:Uncharacterized protein n=1 Tax=Pyricularia grisea TaxID=148305 RepID=A0A6P8BLR1_PYRGI|nr:uncharacterized protein PgNI_00658 [Pyricularia grisea]TLD17758.1 hypothetical protein PgNI_00658 [Pyricularia grisea]
MATEIATMPRLSTGSGSQSGLPTSAPGLGQYAASCCVMRASFAIYSTVPGMTYERLEDIALYLSGEQPRLVPLELHTGELIDLMDPGEPLPEEVDEDLLGLRPCPFRVREDGEEGDEACPWTGLLDGFCTAGGKTVKGAATQPPQKSPEKVMKKLVSTDEKNLSAVDPNPSKARVTLSAEQIANMHCPIKRAKLTESMATLGWVYLDDIPCPEERARQEAALLAGSITEVASQSEAQSNTTSTHKEPPAKPPVKVTLTPEQIRKMHCPIKRAKLTASMETVGYVYLDDIPCPEERARQEAALNISASAAVNSDTYSINTPKETVKKEQNTFISRSGSEPARNRSSCRRALVLPRIDDAIGLDGASDVGPGSEKRKAFRRLKYDNSVDFEKPLYRSKELTSAPPRGRSSKDPTSSSNTRKSSLKQTKRSRRESRSLSSRGERHSSASQKELSKLDKTNQASRRTSIVSSAQGTSSRSPNASRRSTVEMVRIPRPAEDENFWRPPLLVRPATLTPLMGPVGLRMVLITHMASDKDPQKCKFGGPDNLSIVPWAFLVVVEDDFDLTQADQYPESKTQSRPHSLLMVYGDVTEVVEGRSNRVPVDSFFFDPKFAQMMLSAVLLGQRTLAAAKQYYNVDGPGYNEEVCYDLETWSS